MPKWNLRVKPEELEFALQIGSAAGEGLIPMTNPETSGFNLVDEETGEIDKIRFTDNSMNRFGGAIVQEFGEDESKFYSIMNRVFALMRLMEDNDRAKQYLKEDPDDSEHTMIHNALINVMARIPITRDGKFDVDAFFNEVGKINQEISGRNKKKEGTIG